MPLYPFRASEGRALLDLSDKDLFGFHVSARANYAKLKSMALNASLARGMPGPELLALSNAMLGAVVSPEECLAEDGTDCRNYYGGAKGLPEARRLFASMLGVSPEQLMIANNSSLALMHDVITYALLTGVRSGAVPWCRHPGRIAFLCPSPGYDRHFAICEQYGIHMIPIPMTGSGPDMNQVESRVSDPAVKGIWCVPKYSNPTGETYSPEVVRRLAQMRTGAEDFRIMWDNAYCVHDLYATSDELEDILQACAVAGNPDRAFVFASTSKITFAQGGLGLCASSPANVEWLVAHASRRTIGPDKLNQLRHVRMLSSRAGIASHMRAHRRLLQPKFEAVDVVLRRRLAGTGAAWWSTPRGGYFFSIDVLPRCAARVIELARDAGVDLAPAGSCFPYGRDPWDSHIRLAPTYPPLSEVKQAVDAIATCVLLAVSERLLALRAHPV